MQQLPMDTDGALALQGADRVRHAVLGRDAQAQVDVVGQRMPLHQLDPSLTAQLPQDHPDRTPKPPVEDLPAVFRYDHDVVLAVPPHMGQVLPLVHRLPLLPEGAFPEGEPMPSDEAMHAGSLEALRVTRPEAVASGRSELTPTLESSKRPESKPFRTTN